jgi:two-component system, NarL family, response regulator NreC
MEKLRLFLAEDHSVVREGLKLLINSQPDMEVIGEAGDGQEALDKIFELNPDLAVLDISMPGLNGIVITQRLRMSHPEMKILALSVHEDRGYLRELLEAGASGYVLKRAAADDLINAIHVASRGGVYIDLGLTSNTKPSLPLRPSRRRRRRENALSAREAEIVRLIAQGYRNKEIATQLELSVKTVETYKARAMEKLGIGNRAELVRYAVEHGWLTRQEDQS